MVAILDYGVGNLFSLVSSFAAIGVPAVATADPCVLREADRLILPGVGAFGDAARKLRESGMQEELLSAAAEGKPILGICLGMQLLLEASYEYGEHRGLSLIPGAVRPIRDLLPEKSPLKIPHIGWNALHLTETDNPLFRYVNEGDHVYFVHSFYADAPKEHIIANTEYGATVTAAVQSGNVFGCQFHPEKSGKVGLSILRAFSELEVNA